MVAASAQPVPVPFVHPGPFTSPLAFDQPPEYHAQSTCAALSRSPMVAPVCGGRRTDNAVFGRYGWYVGLLVMSAYMPQRTLAGVGGRPGPGWQDAVS